MQVGGSDVLIVLNSVYMNNGYVFENVKYVLSFVFTERSREMGDLCCLLEASVSKADLFSNTYKAVAICYCI